MGTLSSLLAMVAQSLHLAGTDYGLSHTIGRYVRDQSELEDSSELSEAWSVVTNWRTQ